MVCEGKDIFHSVEQDFKELRWVYCTFMHLCNPLPSTGEGVGRLVGRENLLASAKKAIIRAELNKLPELLWVGISRYNMCMHLLTSWGRDFSKYAHNSTHSGH